MKTRVLFALLLTLFTAAAAFASPTIIRGTVVTPDGATRYPDVEVTVVGKGQTVYSDGQGEFYLRNLEPGEYDIRVKTSRSETTLRITALPQPVTDVKVTVR